MNKRILSLVLVLAMVLGTFSFAFAEEEVPATNPKVEWLQKEGLVKGDAGTGDLRLTDPIIRSEVAAMVVRAKGLENVAEASRAIKGSFTDVTPAHWANGYVNVAVGERIVNGYPGNVFKPNKNISYEEIVSMMVRVLGGLTEEEAKFAVGANWAMPYLTKAHELGILEGVDIKDFKAEATREKVFEMVYNTMTTRNFGNYNVVKAIVLENNRVERIGSNEIVVEIIKPIQVANYADASRLEKGEQLRFTLPKDIADVENILGKVADISFDKDNKVARVSVDNSYTYAEGAILATEGKLNVNGTNYTVVMDERYKGQDERIFRTYLNDKAYAYKDFYQDPSTTKDRRRADKFAADYARVTIKNGKVLFIDSFNFDDIAPVKEVKKDGQDVYVYNDYRSARVEKYNPVTVISYTEKDGFKRAAKEDIAEFDVIHVYGKNVIVRKDAKVDGTYKKVSEGRDRGDFFVHVDDEKYYINDVDYRRPVYSYNSKEFETLIAKEAERDLREFKDEKVTVLKDINSDLQYIGAAIEFNEFISVIDDILSRGDVRFVKTDDEKQVLTETFDSTLVIGGTTKNQRMSAFNRGDLVFAINDEDKIDTMNRLATAKEIYNGAKLVEKDKNDDFIINRDYIKVDKDTRYNIVDKTNVFIVNVEKDGTIYKVKKIEGTTVSDVAKNVKSKSDLKAYVLTDKEFDRMDLDNRSRTTGRTDVAHTIIFTDYEGASAKLDHETIEVTHRFISGYDTEIEGKDADGERITRKVDKYAKLPKVEVGDIVDLGITKDDDKIVKDIEILIPYNAKTYRVYDVAPRSGYRAITLEDANRGRKEFWLSRDLEEFGTVALDDVVSFYNDGSDIYVIKSYGRNEKVTGTWDGSEAKINYAKLDAAFKYDGAVWVRIDGKDYKYVGLQDLSVLQALEGKEIGFETIELDREDAVKNIWAVGTKRDALNNAIKDAKALKEEDYTAESWKAADIANAIKVAEAVASNSEAKQDQIDAAKATIDSAVAKLDKKGEETEEITAELTSKVCLGVTNADITVKGAKLEDVEKVLVNGSEVDFDIYEGKVITFNYGGTLEYVEIVVNAQPYDVVIK